MSELLKKQLLQKFLEVQYLHQIVLVIKQEQSEIHKVANGK